MKNRHKYKEISAFELITESFLLLKSTPFLILGTYFIGTLPFVMTFLYFWSDMTLNPLASARLSFYSFILAFLFIWMKTWQTIFSQKLLQHIYNSEESITVKDFWRISKMQLKIQVSGIIFIPISVFTIILFPLVYSFYQNITVLGAKKFEKVSELRKQAWNYSTTNYKQNSIIIWLLSPYQLIYGFVILLIVVPLFQKLFPEIPFYILFPLGILGMIPLNPFGFFITLNILLFIYQVPYLLKMFFGIESIFTMSGPYFLNSTFVVVLISLTYLCLDPMIKAVYTIKCFYYDSRLNGDDIKLKLKKIKRSSSKRNIIFSSCFILFLLFSNSLNAQKEENVSIKKEALISSAQLDQALDEVLAKPIYIWKISKEELQKVDNSKADSFFKKIFLSIRHGIKKIVIKFKKIIKKIIDFFWKKDQINSPDKKPVSNFGLNLKILVSILIIIILIILLNILLKLKYRKLKISENDLEEIKPVPDLNHEDVYVGNFSDSSWFALAKEYEDKGELLLALRALFLGILAYLSTKNWLTLKKFKSVRDYHQELVRRAYQKPLMIKCYNENMIIFEEIWYGNKTINFEIIELFRTNFSKIKNDAEK